MTTVTVESMLEQAQTLAPSDLARLIGALANQLAEPKRNGLQTQAERSAVFDEICGKYADILPSTEQFLADKHADLARENRFFAAEDAQ